MNIFSYPRFEGNKRVIKRLSDLDFNSEQIAQKYQDKGIEITSKVVDVVLSGELDVLAKKSFPKSEVKDLEDEVKDLQSAMTTF